MPYVGEVDRNQMMLASWDALVDKESICRIIDAFVESLDMKELGVEAVSAEGRPAYNPKSMLKLYIYGSRHGIRSSRKLAQSCRVNIEVRWMTGCVEPDFRTIARFRKNNIDVLTKVFHEFNRRISGAVEWGFTSVDGSKFQANNSKEKNFTAAKLDDRIKWLDDHTAEYIRMLEDMDEQEDLDDEQALTRELVQEKLEKAQQRLERYEGYRKVLEESGASQISLTDADAKLMKSKNGFAVSYNPQTAVDSNTHLIRDFRMTNQVTDHGLLVSTLENIRSESKGILETTADKGYNDTDDMAKCLEQGIIPHVVTEKGKDSFHLEIPYAEADDLKPESTDPEELSKCLHAGTIPDAYKNVVSDIKIVEVLRKAKEENQNPAPVGSIYGTPAEMYNRAKEGYFVRDPERNLVYCPAGEVLRQKSLRPNGMIRYTNKTACRHCTFKDKCYGGSSDWPEIDFSKDQLERPCRRWLNAHGKAPDTQKRKRGKRKLEKKKFVRFTLKPSLTKTSQRMCLSEHPFGTIKRAVGATFFLLKGLRQVAGEFALMCLGYNLERAKNLLGFNKMMELMATA